MMWNYSAGGGFEKAPGRALGGWGEVSSFLLFFEIVVGECLLYI